MGSPKPVDRRPATGQPAQPAEQEYKATVIRYTGTMKANNQTRLATFRDGVEMLHLPVETPDRQIPFDDTVNRLPPGALYLTSREMKVYNTKDANGQTHQIMIATGKANVTLGEEFFGTGDAIKYDESKQQLTIEGLDGRAAQARRLGFGGANRGAIIARKIIYNRVADTVNIEGGYSGTGQ